MKARIMRMGKNKKDAGKMLLSEASEHNIDLIDFRFWLSESNRLLAELQKEVGTAIPDPNTHIKKQELVSKLEPIMSALEQQWEALREAEHIVSDAERKIPVSSKRNHEIKLSKFQQQSKKLSDTKKQFESVVRELETTISAAAALNISTEATQNLINNPNNLNHETKDINERMRNLLMQFSALKEKTNQIARLEYAKTLSTYMIYATAGGKGVMTFLLAWMDTLNEATKAAGTIFYPISATFTTLVKLFAFIGRSVQYFIASGQVNEQENERRKQELEEAKKELRQSVVFKFAAFTLNFLSILAFAGVLATPVGWILVAAATTVDWIDDGLGAWRRAKKGLEKFDAYYKDSDLKDSEIFKTERGELAQKVNQTRSAMRWGFANTVAMILIACAPIPFAGPVIGLAGLTLLGAVTLRNVYVVAKPRIKQLKEYFSSKKAKKPEQPEEGIELDNYNLSHKIENDQKPLSRSHSVNESLLPTSAYNSDPDSDLSSHPPKKEDLATPSSTSVILAKTSPEFPSRLTKTQSSESLPTLPTTTQTPTRTRTPTTTSTATPTPTNKR